jgi:hypothetical protein
MFVGSMLGAHHLPAQMGGKKLQRRSSKHGAIAAPLAHRKANGRIISSAMACLNKVSAPWVLPILQELQFRRQCTLRTYCSVGPQIPTCINNNKSNAQKIWPWQVTSDMATQ